jgi:hypothetical protein
VVQLARALEDVRLVHGDEAARIQLTCSSQRGRDLGRVVAVVVDHPNSAALAWARSGDVVVTLGVGEPWRIARSIVDGLPS